MGTIATVTQDSVDTIVNNNGNDSNEIDTPILITWYTNEKLKTKRKVCKHQSSAQKAWNTTYNMYSRWYINT